MDLHADTDHGLSEVSRDLCEDGRVVVVGNGLNDGSCSLGGITGKDSILAIVNRTCTDQLTDTRSDKDTITSELHHKSSIGRGSNTSSSEPVYQLDHLVSQ
jgi:hypothetical protein